jgi:N-acetylglucosamine-6-sulfatase
MLRGMARVALLAALSLSAALFAPLLQPGRAANGSRSLGAKLDPKTEPNVVVILTDDQRWDTLWAMPNIQADLVAPGIDFTNAFVVNALCCPSRATMLTGQYSHTTQVYDNSGTYGGYHSFHEDSSTIATWLHDAGYHTGLIGKYFNGYNTTYIPPGWDRWVVFKNATNGGAYYHYVLNTDGVGVKYGNLATDYSTDVLAGEADSFIRDAPPNEPLFLYFTPFAPHIPNTPAPAYAHAFNDLLPYRPPNYNEEDVSDKPAWVQGLAPLSSTQMTGIDRQRKNEYRTLLSVDDAVHTIVTALSDTGRLSDTLIVFMSDNGWALGEHRWNNKKAAFEESIRIPMVIRYDPEITTPRTDTHLVLNLDIAPTIASVAGVTAPGVDGTSFQPLFADDQAPWRHDFLIEHHSTPSRGDIPTYCGIRDDGLQPEGYTYVAYATGEEELYDLAVDPYELDNVASSPDYASQLAALRLVAQGMCSPTPPGFAFAYDVIPPSVPTSLVATAPTNAEVDLTWSASADNVAVTGYTIYRDGVEVGSVDGATTSFADLSVAADTTYTYMVDAVDGAGNRSSQSDPAVVTTPP